MENSILKYRIYIDFPWNFYGISTLKSGIFMAYRWNIDGILMEYQWNIHGIFMESHVCAHFYNGFGDGTLVEYPLNIYGTFMEFMIRDMELST